MSNLILPPNLQDEEIARFKAKWEEHVKHPPFVPYYRWDCPSLYHTHRYRWTAWLCGRARSLRVKIWGMSV